MQELDTKALVHFLGNLTVWLEPETARKAGATLVEVLRYREELLKKHLPPANPRIPAAAASDAPEEIASASMVASIADARSSESTFECKICLEDRPAATRVHLTLGAADGEDCCTDCMKDCLERPREAVAYDGMPPVLIRDCEAMGLDVPWLVAERWRFLGDIIPDWRACPSAECPGGAIAATEVIAVENRCLCCSGPLVARTNDRIEAEEVQRRAVAAVHGIIGGTAQGQNIFRPCGTCGLEVTKDAACSSLSEPCKECRQRLGHWSRGPAGTDHARHPREPMQQYIPPREWGAARSSFWVLHQIGFFGPAVQTGRDCAAELQQALGIDPAEVIRDEGGNIFVQERALGAVRARAEARVLHHLAAMERGTWPPNVVVTRRRRRFPRRKTRSAMGRKSPTS